MIKIKIDRKTKRYTQARKFPLGLRPFLCSSSGSELEKVKTPDTLNMSGKDDKKGEKTPHVFPKFGKTGTGLVSIDECFYDPVQQPIMAADELPPESDLIKERPLSADKEGPKVRMYKDNLFIHIDKEGTFRKLETPKFVQTNLATNISDEVDRRLDTIMEESRRDLNHAVGDLKDEFERTSKKFEKMFTEMRDLVKRRGSESERSKSESEGDVERRRPRYAMTPRNTIERELEKREKEFMKDPSFNLSATFMSKEYSESTRRKSNRKSPPRREERQEPQDEDGIIETVDEPENQDRPPRRDQRNLESSEEDDRDSEYRHFSRFSNPRARRTRHNRTTSEAVVLNARSLQEIHKKAIDLLPWQGPKKDHRTPLQFLREFEKQIVDKLGGCQQTSGEIFYSLIHRSPWCTTWFDILRRGMPYNQMRDIFETQEWNYTCKELYYEEFKKTNKDNSRHSNFVQYFNYWADRFEDTKHDQGFIIDKFRNNLPERFQSDIDLNQIRTIKAFGKMISRIPYRDLEWSPLHKEMTIERREEILAEMGVKGYEKKKGNKDQKDINTPEKKNYKEEKSGYYKKYSPKNVNQISIPEDQDETQAEN